MKILSVIMLSLLLTVSSCASQAGDKIACPECDNKTEVLVGAKCVSIDEVEECGPDGHAHGEECHCFSSQEVTIIEEKQFCLQEGCGEASDEIVEDIDEHACEAFESGVAESVTAADSIGDFDTVHVDQEELVEVTLTAGTDNFFHFGVSETGDYALYMNTVDLFVKAFDKNKKELEFEDMNANVDCPENFPQVYHILANADGSMTPVIVQFKKVETETVVKIFIHKAGQTNE